MLSPCVLPSHFEPGAHHCHVVPALDKGFAGFQEVGGHAKRETMYSRREPKSKMPRVGEEDGIRLITIGQAKIGVKMVFAVVHPEQHRNLCRTGDVEGRIWSLDKEHEIGRRVD